MLGCWWGGGGGGEFVDGDTLGIGEGDGVAGEGGEVGQQGVEAVGGVAVGGAAL